MASISTHRLNTSQTIPAIGFGTWQDKDVQEKAVAEALKAGYKHIDTAAGRFTNFSVFKAQY
jgi:alcohol dehydrogenase (NADP+)